MDTIIKQYFELISPYYKFAPVPVSLQLARAIHGLVSTNLFLLEHYGPAGLSLAVFGSVDVLRMGFEVLASDGDEVALNFKKATQDESTMIAVAVRTTHSSAPI
jgi:hypothetical protein